uniref:Ig-like domain-containing protein n=1 Tax=Meleagris gallopavo TaxID=9103 RepID=A0A803XPB1_MELGA
MEHTSHSLLDAYWGPSNLQRIAGACLSKEGEKQRYLLLIILETPHIGPFIISMQDRSYGQSLPLPLMQKETYCAERDINKGYPKNMTEASSCNDIFYDSLSGIQNGEFSNELSAFLTQEEICKSLDIARESIANSMKEDQNIAPEFTHFNTAVSSALEHASFQDTKLHEQGALPRSQASSLTSSSASHIPPVNQKEQFNSPKVASGFVTVSRKQESISPLLAASPSYVRSLKHSEKRASAVPTTKSESASQGEVPFRNKLCDKAATFIEELSSIFREAAKTRGRSPDGDSSPDSGYLSPKKKQSTLSTSRNKDYNKPHQESEPGPKLSGVDLNGEPRSEKESVAQSEMVLCHPFTNAEDHQPSPPQFTQKLRSQEVAEGNKVLLECRVAGNPVPDVRGIWKSHCPAVHERLFKA